MWSSGYYAETTSRFILSAATTTPKAAEDQ